ncbi:hypothetical protein [Hymenobacter properus]|uniref:Uncharacterized protein n=1 Tax=Hymenobacter properus TaxID=2791026 RepID=A0A931FKW9_9BACT|nr:hypothetical protein [Hymenobacter properus]MBF9140144.1 hypothetical protein [Hymenobacter properus]MBR7718951.1 hypothetical protein [Microvirga sp. SRT04]
MNKTQVVQWASIPVGTLGFLALFGLGMGLTSESYNIFAPYIDTQFAQDYSPDKFEQVTIGMSEDNVRQLVGLPLFENINPYKTEAEELIASEADAKHDMGAQLYNLMRAHYDTRVYKLWEYTNDGKLYTTARLAGSNNWNDFAWYRSSVSLDSAGIVISIDKGWSYD